MPDCAAHYLFGQEVRERLSPEIRDRLLDTPYTFALYGPDIWFMYQIWKRRQGRGRRMHTTKTGAFLLALADRAKEGQAREEAFSYLAGFLCHYALDGTAHPYIVWETTRTWPTKRAHRDFEHALDISLLTKKGVWGEKHPLTDHYFPSLRLPESLGPELEAAYGQVYGWKNVRDALNRCYRMYRMLYREMEKPVSFLTGLVRIMPTDGMKSIPYIRSAFLERDVENEKHRTWQAPYSGGFTSTESFADLWGKAREEAVRMIGACRAYAFGGTMNREELAKVIGNRSYLSGLDVEDPRNLELYSLRPPKD